MQRLSCRLPSYKSHREAAAQEFELDGTKGEGVPSLQFLALDALHRESLDELTKEGCNKAFGPPSISPVSCALQAGVMRSLRVHGCGCLQWRRGRGSRSSRRMACARTRTKGDSMLFR